MKQLLRTGAALLLLVLAGAGGLRAQQFRPGWVLPLQGDTLRGEVEDNAWDEEPTAVRLRTGPGAMSIELNGSKLRAFGVRGRQCFRRETLPLDRTARTQLAQLPVGLRVQQKAESVLAEVLVDGPATLLHLAVERVQHYFVQRPGQPFVEVTERSYWQLRGGRQYVADGNNYRAVLEQYFGDCLPAAQLAMRARFTQAGLTAIVQEFNQRCGGAAQPASPASAQPASQRFAANLGVLVGARYASYRLHSSSGGAVLASADLDGQLHLMGGTYLDVLLPTRRTAFHAAVVLSTYGRNGTVSTQSPTIISSSLDAQQTILEVRLGGRWLWPLRQQGTLLLGIGLARPLLLDGNADVSYTTSAGPAGLNIETTYPTSYLPYLEAGLRRGRLTATAEGRVGFSSYNHGVNPATGSSIEYHVVPFYVGLSVGAALLRQP